MEKIIDRMNYLERKISECSAAIKYQALGGKELSAVKSDLREYENEYNDLKLQLANTEESN